MASNEPPASSSRFLGVLSPAAQLPSSSLEESDGPTVVSVVLFGFWQAESEATTRNGDDCRSLLGGLRRREFRVPDTKKTRVHPLTGRFQLSHAKPLPAFLPGLHNLVAAGKLESGVPAMS